MFTERESNKKNPAYDYEEFIKKLETKNNYFIPLPNKAKT